MSKNCVPVSRIGAVKQPESRSGRYCCGEPFPWLSAGSIFIFCSCCMAGVAAKQWVNATSCVTSRFAASSGITAGFNAQAPCDAFLCWADGGQDDAEKKSWVISKSQTVYQWPCNPHPQTQSSWNRLFLLTDIHSLCTASYVSWRRGLFEWREDKNV